MPKYSLHQVAGAAIMQAIQQHATEQFEMKQQQEKQK